MALTDNDAYSATLDRLRHDLAQAEARIEKLRAGISAIEELIETPSAERSARFDSSNGSRSKALPQGMTMRDAAIAALDLNGRPLRVRQIYDSLMTLGYPYEKGYDIFRGSMTPTLDRLTNIFEKVEPGLYALAKWPKEQKTPAAEVRAGGLLDHIKF